MALDFYSRPEQKFPLVTTDEQALLLLPAQPLVAKAYHGFRAEGQTPQEAVKETLALWRELVEGCRPTTLKRHD